MRIAFAGTPDFAVPSLRALAGLAPRHELVAVVTQPDRPRGRSVRPLPPPVRSAALELGVSADRILQPKSINRAEALARLRSLAPDLCCVIAYGGIFGAKALAAPRLFCLAAHASLLPRYRGAAPIHAALLAGEPVTGVTVFRMEAGCDAGPILLRRELPIGPDDTAATLHDRLAELSAQCFLEAVKRVEAGDVAFAPQDAAQVTYAPKLTKESGRLDWRKDADCLERFVRAMNPWPGAWTAIRAYQGGAERRLRIVDVAKPVATQARDVAQASCLPLSCRLEACATPTPGQAWFVAGPGEARLEALCGDGRILPVLAVQPAGGREMRVAEFLRGAGRVYAHGAHLR